MDKKRTLKKIKNKLEEEIKVKKVYLFGSRARGTYRENSDYDVAVISPDFEGKSFSRRQRIVRPLIRKALGDVPLDVACYTQEEFEKGKKAFLPSIIEKEGVSI